MDINDFQGFGFSAYRSIGEQTVKIGPLKKINFIIGQNNTGKSNIINYLHQHYSYVLGKINHAQNYSATDKSTFGELDKTIGSNSGKRAAAFALDEKQLSKFIDSLISPQMDAGNKGYYTSSLKKILSTFREENGLYWFEYHMATSRNEFILKYDQDLLVNVLSQQEWNSLWTKLTNQTGGDFRAHWFPEVMRKLACRPDYAPRIEVIPAIRRIGESGSVSEDFSGAGIIDRLAKLESPALNERNNRDKFNKINRFIQTVLDNPSATLTIPYERDTILVEIDRRMLPLTSLGTGIHEVVILASASTILENTIVCIEEPELHLHPLLQKKLVKYLAINTNNKYLFTTHSAHLLDAVDAEIFHVTQSQGITSVAAVDSTRSRSGICQDLGYRASDILQANCVIWVEGPSDRIYLNHWLASMNTGFVEGIHYSIMFYGGRLFSHLTALDSDDEQVADFISVRDLNRNAVIMFDSDASSARSSLNETKLRLQGEFNAGPGFAWVTKGREVENYLDPNRVQECIIKVHPSAILAEEKGVYTNLLNYRTRKKDVVTANKVRVAREYIEAYPADLSILDLKPMMEKLCTFIASCN
ncbi:AAA family ATPase [Citrobacter freundii]|uniref:AAA family ATPase n=1 Tax=Citrobacter freundii TaxID=546 RepID=UPI001B35DD0E|nr:AAA family ATPase [Citrobacter freundii]MBQ0345320.1 AAA family ATPase [Citrobacter freundii]